MTAGHVMERVLERIHGSRFDANMSEPADPIVSTDQTSEKTPNEAPGIPVNRTLITPDLSGAAWLESDQVLLIADLHLEKGSAFAGKGVFLPPYDTRASLTRLAETMARYQPRCVISLGDSFHDPGASRRIHRDDAAHLAGIVKSVPDWIWIEGNHDPAPPPEFGGEVHHELQLGSLILRHEPQPGDQAGEVAGHLHPCAKVRANGRSVRRPCFASDGTRLILPSFGAFTGGLNVCDGAYADLFESRPDVWMLGRDQVYQVSAKRLRPDGP